MSTYWRHRRHRTTTKFRRFFYILFHHPRLFHIFHDHDEQGFCQ